MRVLLIHGAGSSSICWKYFRDRLKAESFTYDYDVTDSFGKILMGALDRADEVEADAVVGHSFGGVIGWHLADCSEDIVCGSSIASPWGGSLYAEMVEMCTLGLLPTRFFGNIMRGSLHSKAARERPVPVPWMNVVTTKGVIGIGQNDGVLTTTSQDSLYRNDQVLRVEMHNSHSEVLFTEDLPQYVDGFVNRVALGLRSRSL